MSEESVDKVRRTVRLRESLYEDALVFQARNRGDFRNFSDLTEKALERLLQQEAQAKRMNP